MWWEGKTRLTKVDKNLSADGCVEVLQTELLPWANANFLPAGWKLVHDGDGTHTARKTKQWIQEKRLDVPDQWPAHSPDLNIIENVWGRLKERLGYLDIRTMDELWRQAQRVWREIAIEEIRNCIRSMPRRLKAVRDAQGGHTNY